MFVRTASLAFALFALAACQSAPKDEPMCLQRKPGTIVSVNQYCAVNLSDPVDPTLVEEWRGQKVSFCCKGCLPKWEKMSAAEKDAALAAAVAKGPIKD